MPANPELGKVYSATYSNVPVYELYVDKVHVMRRRSDDWINATHILKVADFDKPARTRILEREVQKGVHEKVQGGYGKYQGTWIPLPDGRALAERNGCLEKMRPIFDFVPGDRSPPPAPKHATAASSKPRTNRQLAPPQRQRMPGTNTSRRPALCGAAVVAEAQARRAEHRGPDAPAVGGRAARLLHAARNPLGSVPPPAHAAGRHRSGPPDRRQGPHGAALGGGDGRSGRRPGPVEPRRARRQPVAVRRNPAHARGHLHQQLRQAQHGDAGAVADQHSPLRRMVRVNRLPPHRRHHIQQVQIRLRALLPRLHPVQDGGELFPRADRRGAQQARQERRHGDNNRGAQRGPEVRTRAHWPPRGRRYPERGRRDGRRAHRPAEPASPRRPPPGPQQQPVPGRLPLLAFGRGWRGPRPGTESPRRRRAERHHPPLRARHPDAAVAAAQIGVRDGAEHAADPRASREEREAGCAAGRGDERARGRGAGGGDCGRCAQGGDRGA
ncbi:Transcription factor mbp1 [Zalaria obscura]|uniref:Transcription factor mbp1 n=1 Tax=Zalaria obscura TaxID=2024903 RepID=A0ACC3SHQ6_9PEZI